MAKLRGFTLIEVLIAVGILSIAVVFVFTLFSRGSWVINHSRNRTVAMFLAKEKLEEVMASPILFVSTPTGRFSGTFSRFSYTVLIHEYLPSVPDMKLIQVEVEGPHGGKVNLIALKNMQLSSVAAGGHHNLVVREDGSVWSWGFNAYGQLGNHANGPLLLTPYPTPVCATAGSGTGICLDAFGGAKQVAGGFTHTLILRNDGTVWSVGRNQKGELGDGTTEDRNVPVQVVNCHGCAGPFLADVNAVYASMSDDLSLALKSDGTVWAWGDNLYGQLGNHQNGESAHRTVPVEVCEVPYGETACKNPFSDVASLAAGYDHAFALKKDGTVWAWGHNESGRLGNNASDSVIIESAPVQVCAEAGQLPGTCKGFLANVIAIATGYDHTIALKSDGTVWTWGNNYFGQLGNNDMGALADTRAPVQVCEIPGDIPGSCKIHLRNVIAIAAGGYHSLALKSDHTLWAWGNNGFGQLGNNSSGNGIFSPVPTQVCATPGTSPGTCGQFFRGVTDISGGYYHSLALKSDGTIWVWGNNVYGQGDHGTSSLRDPIPVQISRF